MAQIIIIIVIIYCCKTAKIAEREKELANVDEELEMALLNSEGEQLAFEEEEDTGRPDQLGK